MYETGSPGDFLPPMSETDVGEDFVRLTHNGQSSKTFKERRNLSGRGWEFLPRNLHGLTLGILSATTDDSTGQLQLSSPSFEVGVRGAGVRGGVENRSLPYQEGWGVVVKNIFEDLTRVDPQYVPRVP